MIRTTLGACAASAVIASAASRAAAHEPDSYGLGSRSTAMGGAVTADATDFSACYYNPANLAGAEGLSLSVGYTYVDNDLAINGRDNDVDSVHGLVAGIVAPGKLFGIPFAFGIATFLPDDGVSRIKALKQEVPRWELYDVRSSILFLATHVAIKPAPWLEIGGGLAYLAATRGRFEISGRADVLAPYDSQLRHEVDADLTTIRYPIFGARVEIGDLGKLAIAYRGENKLDLRLEAHLEGDITFAGVDVPLLYDLETRTIAAFQPQQVVLGASFTKVPRLVVNVDVSFVNWAAYESPTARTRAHLEADPPAGLPVDLPDDPKPTRVVPPEFENRFVPRVGAEYRVPIAGAPRKLPSGQERRLLEAALRAGYVYEASPVPPQTGVTNFVDADRHTISAGIGATLNAPAAELPGSLALDGHVMYSVLPERSVEKVNQADFVGPWRASGSMLGFGGVLSATF